MIGRFNYKLLSKYPHLRPEDVAIWEKFLSAHPDFYDSVDYDLKVGEGRDYSEMPGDEFRADMEYLSKKRIDVVGYKGDEIHIIELKPQAGFSAVGQVLGYAKLFAATGAAGKRIVPVVITDEELPDVRNFCLKMGVLLLIL